MSVPLSSSDSSRVELDGCDRSVAVLVCNYRVIYRVNQPPSSSCFRRRGAALMTHDEFLAPLAEPDPGAICHRLSRNKPSGRNAFARLHKETAREERLFNMHRVTAALTHSAEVRKPEELHTGGFTQRRRLVEAERGSKLKSSYLKSNYMYHLSH